jgi:hypothetical protein
LGDWKVHSCGVIRDFKLPSQHFLESAESAILVGQSMGVEKHADTGTTL